MLSQSIVFEIKKRMLGKIMLVLSQEELEAIRDNKLSTFSRIRDTHISPEDIRYLISTILAGNTSVVRFVFAGCLLNDDHVDAFTSALKHDGRSIDYVNMSECYITDKGLLMLLRLGTVREIKCYYNTVTDIVVPEILSRDKSRSVSIGLGAGDSISDPNSRLILDHFKRDEIEDRSDSQSESSQNSHSFFSTVPVESDSDESDVEEEQNQQQWWWCNVM